MIFLIRTIITLPIISLDGTLVIVIRYRKGQLLKCVETVVPLYLFMLGVESIKKSSTAEALTMNDFLYNLFS